MSTIWLLEDLGHGFLGLDSVAVGRRLGRVGHLVASSWSVQGGPSRSITVVMFQPVILLRELVVIVQGI